jgi:hypothetical protein
MIRRDFLKISGLASMLLALNLGHMENLVNLQAQATAGGKMYRGSLDGKIYVSADQGQTWAMHTSLGEASSILGLFTLTNGQVVAEVWFQGHPFHLALTPDGRSWRTVPASTALA